MPKKKTEHYVKNADLLEAMIVYRAKVSKAKEIFIKCQGGIEILQGMLDEESKDKKDKK